MIISLLEAKTKDDAWLDLAEQLTSCLTNDGSSNYQLNYFLSKDIKRAKYDGEDVNYSVNSPAGKVRIEVTVPEEERQKAIDIIDLFNKVSDENNWGHKIKYSSTPRMLVIDVPADAPVQWRLVVADQRTRAINDVSEAVMDLVYGYDWSEVVEKLNKLDEKEAEKAAKEEITKVIKSEFPKISKAELEFVMPEALDVVMDLVEFEDIKEEVESPRNLINKKIKVCPKCGKEVCECNEALNGNKQYNKNKMANELVYYGFTKPEYFKDKSLDDMWDDYTHNNDWVKKEDTALRKIFDKLITNLKEKGYMLEESLNEEWDGRFSVKILDEYNTGDNPLSKAELKELADALFQDEYDVGWKNQRECIRYWLKGGTTRDLYDELFGIDEALNEDVASTIPAQTLPTNEVKDFILNIPAAEPGKPPRFFKLGYIKELTSEIPSKYKGGRDSEGEPMVRIFKCTEYSALYTGADWKETNATKAADKILGAERHTGEKTGFTHNEDAVNRIGTYRDGSEALQAYIADHSRQKVKYFISLNDEDLHEATREEIAQYLTPAHASKILSGGFKAAGVDAEGNNVYDKPINRFKLSNIYMIGPLGHSIM